MGVLIRATGSDPVLGASRAATLRDREHHDLCLAPSAGQGASSHPAGRKRGAGGWDMTQPLRGKGSQGLDIWQG